MTIKATEADTVISKVLCNHMIVCKSCNQFGEELLSKAREDVLSQRKKGIEIGRQEGRDEVLREAVEIADRVMRSDGQDVEYYNGVEVVRNLLLEKWQSYKAGVGK